MKYIFLLGLVSSLSFSRIIPNINTMEELDKTENFYKNVGGEFRQALFKKNPNIFIDIEDTRKHLEKKLEAERNKKEEPVKQVDQRVFVYDLAQNGQYITMNVIRNNQQFIHTINRYTIISAPICNNVLCSFVDNTGQQFFFNRTSIVLPKLQQILYGKTF